MTIARVTVSCDTSDGDLSLVPGENLYTGEKKIVEHFGSCTTLERDLLNLSAGIYAADIGVKRFEREHYIRTITLQVEVVNKDRFELVKRQLEHALHILSRDNWTLDFVAAKTPAPSNNGWGDDDGAVLLFSGGIDSMSAAAKFMGENRKLVLVSHNSQANRAVDEAQNKVHQALQDYYKKDVNHVHVKVYGRTKDQFLFPRDEDRENTQRTRSFLFLSLAAIVTRRSHFNRVLFMAENGQFAIHLPLNSARVGPFSTHTADPEFLSLAQEIFRLLMDNPKFQIENPFMYMTKAEVFGVLPQELRKRANLSATCWMISRLNQHCGYCIPCISRRIALEFHGVKFPEYETDLFSLDVGVLDDSNDRKRNLIDYLEFIYPFLPNSSVPNNELVMLFPELFSPSFDQARAIEMYRRVAVQSNEVLQRYPNVKKLMA